MIRLPFALPLRRSEQRWSFPSPHPYAPIAYDRNAYRTRNLVERPWRRLEDWRRVATRYDKIAAHYFSGALIAAIVVFWYNLI
jgi:transposase